MTLGQRIRTLRLERNLSQEWLAEELGITRQAVSKWETDSTVPDTENLLKLATLFNVPVEHLATGRCVTAGDGGRSRRLIKVLKRTSLCFFMIALACHIAGIITGEFTRNLIPVFPYLWYGKSAWAIVLNAFTALFSVGWMVTLAAARALNKREN